MRRLTFFTGIIFIIASLSAAQEAEKQEEPRAVTIDDVLSFRTISDIQISSDGNWILYVVTTPDLEENERNSDIFRVPFEGGDPVRMTTSTKSDTTPRWAPDGQTIAFLSARDGKAQIYTLHAFGGEAEKLTSHDEAISSFEWRPDGKAILFRALEPLSKKKEEEQKAKRDAIVVDENPRPQHLWLFDLEIKKAEQVTKGTYSVANFDWSPDGESIVFSAAEKPKAFESFARTDIYIIKPGDEEAELLYVNSGPDGSPIVSPCGKCIAFTSRRGELNPVGGQSIMWMDLESREVKNLTDGFTPTIAGSLTWVEGKGILFRVVDRTKVHFYRVHPKNGSLTNLTADETVFGAFSISEDGKRIAFIREDAQTAPDACAAELDGSGLSDARRLTKINPEVQDWKLGRTEVVSWQSSEGMEIEGLLVYPTDFEEGKRYPLYVKIHGGPSGVFTQNFQMSAQRCPHYFAGLGWATLHPNVRGSIGYGDVFQQANINDWGGGDYRDILTGVDKVIEMGVADPDKLAVQGWSYGGYMTAWVVSQTDRFKAAAVGAGLTNLVSMYGTNDIPQVMEWYFSGDIYSDSLRLYRDRSALTHAANITTPTLIQHGQNDARVPIGQAQEFYYAIKKKGVPTQLVFYPREGHGPREINHQRDILQRLTTWFSRHVLGVEMNFEEEEEEKGDDGEEKASEKQ